MRCLCVIPARGGSKRLPGKNIRPFLGEPIIYRPIRVAKASELFEDVIVSTDDGLIVDAVKYQPVTTVSRAPELCNDEATDLDVVRDIADRYPHDYLCYLYPTAALVTVEQIRRGLDWMIRTGRPMVYTQYADCLQDAGQFSWYDLAVVRTGENVKAEASFIDLDPMEAQDINTAEDFELAEMKARWRG